MKRRDEFGRITKEWELEIRHAWHRPLEPRELKNMIMDCIDELESLCDLVRRYSERCNRTHYPADVCKECSDAERGWGIWRKYDLEND